MAVLVISDTSRICSRRTSPAKMIHDWWMMEDPINVNLVIFISKSLATSGCTCSGDWDRATDGASPRI